MRQTHKKPHRNEHHAADLVGAPLFGRWQILLFLFAGGGRSALLLRRPAASFGRARGRSALLPPARSRLFSRFVGESFFCFVGQPSHLSCIALLLYLIPPAVAKRRRQPPQKPTARDAFAVPGSSFKNTVSKVPARAPNLSGARKGCTRSPSSHRQTTAPACRLCARP